MAAPRATPTPGLTISVAPSSPPRLITTTTRHRLVSPLATSPPRPSQSRRADPAPLGTGLVSGETSAARHVSVATSPCCPLDSAPPERHPRGAPRLLATDLASPHRPSTPQLFSASPPSYCGGTLDARHRTGDQVAKAARPVDHPATSPCCPGKRAPERHPAPATCPPPPRLKTAASRPLRILVLPPRPRRIWPRLRGSFTSLPGRRRGEGGGNLAKP